MLTRFATPRFTADHLWVRVDGTTGLARVGLTAFLAERLTERREAG
ncbi:hypothetical protein [Crossiella sp. CA198]